MAVINAVGTWWEVFSRCCYEMETRWAPACDRQAASDDGSVSVALPTHQAMTLADCQSASGTGIHTTLIKIKHVSRYSAYLPIWVRLLGGLEDRYMKDRCFQSAMSTNAVRYQMAPICSKWRRLEASGTTQTHCNSPITSHDPFWAHCEYGR